MDQDAASMPEALERAAEPEIRAYQAKEGLGVFFPCYFYHHAVPYEIRRRAHLRRLRRPAPGLGRARRSSLGPGRRLNRTGHSPRHRPMSAVV
jgi:hypothetical protein